MPKSPESLVNLPSADSLAPLMADLRRDDRDRYLTALLAPPVMREGLLAVYGFNLEAARVRETVSEELIGRMRLQWWRDRLDDIFAGTPPKHPVAEPLAWAVRRFGLDRKLFEDLIDAREDDLAAGQPDDLQALVGHARQTALPVMRLALQILDQDRGEAAAAAEELAIAQGVSGAARAVPFHMRAGIIRLPVDLCADAGLDVGRLRDRGPAGQEEALTRVIREISGHAEDRLGQARRHRFPRAALPAFLPARLSARDLKRLARADFNPFAGSVMRVDGLRPLVLLAARLRGRV